MPPAAPNPTYRGKNRLKPTRFGWKKGYDMNENDQKNRDILWSLSAAAMLRPTPGTEESLARQLAELREKTDRIADARIVLAPPEGPVEVDDLRPLPPQSLPINPQQKSNDTADPRALLASSAAYREPFVVVSRVV